MKSFTQIIFSLVIVSLAFVACEKDEVLADVGALAEPTETDLAAAYLSQTRSLVLFAALEIEHENNSLSGYIIDKYGELRSIEMQNGMVAQLGKPNASDAMLRKLHEQSTAVEKLSKIELADAYKQAKRLSSKDAASENETIQSSQLYLAFDRDQDVDHNEACSPGVYSTNQTHLQLLISASGHLEGENSGVVTEDLVTWLQSFEKIDGEN